MNFQYIANDLRTGKRIKGVAAAPSVSALVRRLKEEKLLPLQVYERRLANLGAKVKTRVARKPVLMKELIVFTRQLAATLSAGLLLTEGLEAVAEDLENTTFRRVIEDIRESIQSGSDFSTALAQYPYIFSVTYIALVKSGEATGNLDVTMANLAQYLENTERMKEKVRNAVRYPLFVFGFAVFVVMVVVLFIIPQFHGLFSQAGVQLPFLTRMVVGASNFALKFFPFIFAGILCAFLVLRMSLKSPLVRYGVDALILKIPLVGRDIFHKALVSRFCRTFGFLFAGGVGLAKSLEITEQVVNHRLIGQATEKIRQRVVGGGSLAEEIKRQKIFPRLMAKMVAVGERTGKVSEMLTRTSDYYDNELDNAFQKLATLLEPALIIMVGGIILVVVIALYLPIFQMSSAIR